MQIIVLTSRASDGKGVYLPRSLVWGAVLGMLVLAVLLCYGGVRLHDRYQFLEGRTAAADVLTEERLALRGEFGQYRDALVEHKQRTHGHLDAMAARISALQAQVLRLEALGFRLADIAELDEQEFALDTPIGLGGPSPDFESPRDYGFIDRTLQDLETLERRLQIREDAMWAMEGLLMGRTIQDRATPQGAPVQNGWISSPYGTRTDPFTGRREFHRGVDISGRYRSEVYALASGLVTVSAYRGGFGNTVEIEHGEGYVTSYGHNHKNLVEVGQWVDKGDPVAIMGSTGRSTGAHVHFEVLENDRPVNPHDYISPK